jgi:glycosyltransferase involved in cell wall biosynthesis
MQILQVALSGTIGTSRMGPVSTDILELSNHFVALGHDVTVADVRCTEKRSTLDPRVRLLELDGLPQSLAATMRSSKALAQWTIWRNYHKLVKQMMRRLDVAQFDVVHFHASVPGFLAQRLYSLDNVFYTAHTPTWSLDPDSTRSPLSRLVEWTDRQVIRHSQLTIGLGRYLAEAVPGANVTVIQNGINLERWPVLDRTEARKALGVPDESFVLLFVGRLAPVKGIETLLEATRMLAPSLPELRVRIVGPMSGSFDARDQNVAPYALRLQELARDLPAEFLGFVSNVSPEFRQHLAAADVFVLPSRSEPQGMVVLEALAMGTPVIGSTSGGIPDMVSSDVGFVFPAGDADALAAAIMEAHDDRERLDAMRSVARDRVRTEYRWDRVAKRHLTAYRNALTGSEIPVKLTSEEGASG